MQNSFKSGFVAILGEPNVGKSTILNYLLGTHLAVVTPKPETTRDKIRGALTTQQGQIIFVDTPGIHRPHTLLGKHMVRQAKESLYEADIVLAVIDARKGSSKNDQILFQLIQQSNKKAILLINKVDLIDRRFVLPLIEKCGKLQIFTDYIPISATKGENMQLLLPKLFEYLPEGEKLFPDDYLTDRPQRFFVCELIREQVLRLTREEIPHSVAVLVEEMKKRPGKDLYYIEAVIFVERDSQKAIIIGKRGQMLKHIGEASRKNIEEWLQKKVFLQLFVKVYKNWRKDPGALKMLGYV